MYYFTTRTAWIMGRQKLIALVDRYFRKLATMAMVTSDDMQQFWWEMEVEGYALNFKVLHPSVILGRAGGIFEIFVDNIEGFLTALEGTLLKEAFRRRRLERPDKKKKKSKKSFKK